MTAQEMADRWRKSMSSGEAAKRFAARVRRLESEQPASPNAVKTVRDILDKTARKPKG